MHRQFVQAPGTQRIHTRVVPDIRTRSTMLTELEVVDVRRRPTLEHNDELVLRAIKRAHSGIRLIPDAHVLELGIDISASRKDFTDVSPVHTDLVNRAISRRRS